MPIVSTFLHLLVEIVVGTEYRREGRDNRILPRDIDNRTNSGAFPFKQLCDNRAVEMNATKEITERNARFKRR